MISYVGVVLLFIRVIYIYDTINLHHYSKNSANNKGAQKHEPWGVLSSSLRISQLERETENRKHVRLADFFTEHEQNDKFSSHRIRGTTESDESFE